MVVQASTMHCLSSMCCSSDLERSGVSTSRVRQMLSSWAFQSLTSLPKLLKRGVLVLMVKVFFVKGGTSTTKNWPNTHQLISHSNE